ncbi:hypothetical protein SAMN05444161_2772 [Rhizobiales bacterium GAS191]|jgi:hypothetical protein|nr:hypothetical protein SAMN05519103_01973 [Rhizobiales bacterium GAS113]SEC00974.1 hypothetical protein SAMN05519104_0562 [Rhizobiales bacterium GAS188]SED21409.1 hypothetical protein SAMN05444161_2772 [Rhizobiales bacterium GAS191]
MSVSSLRHRGWAAIAVGVLLALGLATGAAQARSCTVDLDEVQLIRKEILDLVKSNIQLDANRAGEVRRKYGDALKGGPVTVDPNDFKGILNLKGKPSPALIRDLLARVQNIIASCQ